MPCSQAQLEANRRNSRNHSTGPKTAEGKAISRRNSLKHGLTGARVVLPTDDEAEVARRFEALEAELAPKSELARMLVNRVATLALRMEHCAEHEAKNSAHRMRHATEAFDDQRLAEAEKALSWIATEPATHARRLRATPEGVDMLVDGLERLKASLGHPEGVRWDWTYCEQVHHLTGRRRLEVPVTRFRALSEAIEGNFRHLESADGAGLADLERRCWAAGMLVKLIGEEVEALKALREGLDHETIALDRAEAPHRAMFDTSPSAALLRKYEASAERGFFRALRELREVQAAMPEPPAGPEPEVEVEAEVVAETEVAAESGSFFPEGPGAAGAASPPDPITRFNTAPASDLMSNGPNKGAPPDVGAAPR
jgi:hypothetical protein